jgi:hypothetical protein
MNEQQPTENKPLYAAAGVADAAIETLRELPGKIAALATDPEVRSDMKARFEKLPDDAKALREDVPEFFKEAPGKASDLPDRLRAFFGEASSDVAKAYDDMAARGESAVAKFRAEHGDTIDRAIGTVREKAAGAADDVADAADNAADAISKRSDDDSDKNA